MLRAPPHYGLRVEGRRGLHWRWGNLGSLAAPSAGCSADHPSTSDRYSSMRFDPIDTLIDTFDSPGVLLSVRVGGRCSAMLDAQG